MIYAKSRESTQLTVRRQCSLLLFSALPLYCRRLPIYYPSPSASSFISFSSSTLYLSSLSSWLTCLTSFVLYQITFLSRILTSERGNYLGSTAIKPGISSLGCYGFFPPDPGPVLPVSDRTLRTPCSCLWCWQHRLGVSHRRPELASRRYRRCPLNSSDVSRRRRQEILEAGCSARLLWELAPRLQSSRRCRNCQIR